MEGSMSVGIELETRPHPPKALIRRLRERLAREVAVEGAETYEDGPIDGDVYRFAVLFNTDSATVALFRALRSIVGELDLVATLEGELGADDWERLIAEADEGEPRVPWGSRPPGTRELAWDREPAEGTRAAAFDAINRSLRLSPLLCPEYDASDLVSAAESGRVAEADVRSVCITMGVPIQAGTPLSDWIDDVAAALPSPAVDTFLSERLGRHQFFLSEAEPGTANAKEAHTALAELAARFGAKVD
jgi:hypothetical protein